MSTQKTKSEQPTAPPADEPAEQDESGKTAGPKDETGPGKPPADAGNKGTKSGSEK